MGKAFRAKRRRLAGWDHSTAGTYFVTFCTYGRTALFGKIVSGEMMLSPAGDACKAMLAHCPEVERFIVMPNHVHALVSLHENDAVSISTLVRVLKSKVTMACRQTGIRGKIWQLSFHGHVVRNQQDHDRLYEYIETNPLRWKLDCMNAAAISQTKACATKGGCISPNGVRPEGLRDIGRMKGYRVEP